MIIYCAQCQIPLTKPLSNNVLQHTPLGSAVFLKKGHANWVDSKSMPALDGLIGVELNETINAKIDFHEGNNGCCGHISDLFCRNGHLVGKNINDCWADLNGFNAHWIRMC